MADTVEFTELDTISELADDLEKDFERLFEPNFSGKKAIKIVRRFGEEDDPKSPSEFRDDLGWGPAAPGAVTNNLAGEGERRGRKFDERPVVSRDDDDGKAELTTYGNLIYHLMDSDQDGFYDSPQNTLHAFLLDRSECDPQIERWISTVLTNHYILGRNN